MHGTGFVSFGRAERVRKRINQKLVIVDAAVTPGPVRTKLGGGACRAQKLRAGRLAGEAGAGRGAGGGVRVEPRTGAPATGPLLFSVWFPFFAFNHCI